MKRNLLKSKKFFFLFIVLTFLFAELGYPKEGETAQYPSRPITFICPPPTGSSADLISRFIAKEAERFLGQPIVVINKPGAGNTLGVAAIAASKPDGYTIGYTPPSAMLLTPFMEKLPYHPLKDFQQIIQITEVPFAVYVKSDSPFKTFKDFIDFARQNPNKVSYATSGAFSSPHLTMLQIAKKEGVQFIHIPVKGRADFDTQLLGGHIDSVAGDIQYTLLDAGQYRILVVLGEKRLIEYPQFPTLKDLGYDISEIIPPSVFINVAGPKGMPEETVKKLEETFTKAIKEPTFIKALKEIHLSISYRNSKEMSDYMANSYEFYRKLLKEMGFIK